MEITTIITILSIWLNFLLLALYIFLYRDNVAFEDLIFLSPSICFVCLGSEHSLQTLDPDPVFGPHDYIEAKLVYVPEALVQELNNGR